MVSPLAGFSGAFLLLRILKSTVKVPALGKRIGKTHLTYAQGASAELVAALYWLLRTRL